jgi:8-hydroxy-5-deazaflavin:NADPH oxidoreductase
MKRKIGVIGAGNVGKALSRGADRAGYEVRMVARDPAQTREVVAWAELVILAVPFHALDSVINRIGDGFGGKVIVDVTNALTQDMHLALGYSTSGAEELQKKLPAARVVKAFNTVFAQHMDTGRLGDKPLTALVAADDVDAKAAVLELARDIGFDAVDAGPLQNARMIEPMAFLNIQLGYVLGMGQQIGFELLHP